MHLRRNMGEKQLCLTLILSTWIEVGYHPHHDCVTNWMQNLKISKATSASKLFQNGPDAPRHLSAYYTTPRQVWPTLSQIGHVLLRRTKRLPKIYLTEKFSKKAAPLAIPFPFHKIIHQTLAIRARCSLIIIIVLNHWFLLFETASKIKMGATNTNFDYNRKKMAF